MSDEDLLVGLKRVLNDYLASVNGSIAVFIATLDGHLLLERSKDDHPLEQVAPMAGSVLGISETLASQLFNQNLQDNIIIMENNILGLMKIIDKEDSLFLGVYCDRMVNLGQILTYGRITIKAINKILEEQV